MDARSDGEARGARRAAGAHREAADEHNRPAGAGAEPRRRDPESPPERHRAERGPSVTTTPSPDPAQPPSSEPAKSAGWLILALTIVVLALLVLPWFIFSIVIAAPLALVALGIAALYLASRRRKRDWPTSRR